MFNETANPQGVSSQELLSLAANLAHDHGSDGPFVAYDAIECLRRAAEQLSINELFDDFSLDWERAGVAIEESNEL